MPIRPICEHLVKYTYIRTYINTYIYTCQGRRDPHLRASGQTFYSHLGSTQRLDLEAKNSHLYICMYVCMYVCMYELELHMHECDHFALILGPYNALIWRRGIVTCICVCMYVCVCVCMCVLMPFPSHADWIVCSHIHVYTYICIYIYIHTHIYIKTHIYTPLCVAGTMYAFPEPCGLDCM
jgi:hypothetical protein